VLWPGHNAINVYVCGHAMRKVQKNRTKRRAWRACTAVSTSLLAMR
jgi:hypothetical protein